MILMEQEPQTQAFKAYFDQDLFAAQCGISIVEMRSGYARTQMVAEDRHLNSFGAVHGGALFTLADMAFAAAANAHGTLAVGLNCTMSYTKAAPKGLLIAEAVEDSLSPRIATYLIHIKTGTGDQVATFQGMAYRKGVPLEKAGRLDTGTDTPASEAR